MHKKTVLSLLAALLLLSCASVGFAGSAGSSTDPIVTRSFAEGAYTDSLLDMGAMTIDASLSGYGAEKGSTGTFASHTAPTGSTVALSTGGSVVLLSGRAVMSISRGVVIDVTNGAEVPAGSLSLNTRYLAAEDSEVLVTVTTAGSLAVDGAALFTAGADAVFTDVSEADWFHGSVLSAARLGMVKGYEDGSFRPASTMTVAEAVTLAARIHQRYHEGEATLTNGTDVWYSTYAAYARENGITARDYTAQEFVSPITRGEFVAIFYNSLPASEYAVKNSVADGAIPDVAMDDEYAAQIYAFYRAGILTGYTGTIDYAANSFIASNTIARSEVAAIVVRMFSADDRVAVTLG